MKIINVTFVCVALLLSTFTHADAGSKIIHQSVDYATGKYNEVAVDLSVTTIGGYLEAKRTFSNKQWNFNRGAQGAELSFAREHDAQPSEIKISGISYKLDPNSVDENASEGDPNAVYFTERENDLAVEESSIEKLGDQYRWADSTGSWVNFDEKGQLIEGGNRNTVVTRTTRDSQNRIFQVLDAKDQLIFTYEYVSSISDKVSNISDYSGRTVSYQWQGELLTQVTDVRGEAWKYDYSISGELIGRTDPLGRRTKLYYVSGLVTRLDDPLGNSTQYSYDYDEVRKQYYMRSEDNSGRIIEQRYRQDGQLIEQRINGLLVQKVIENAGSQAGEKVRTNIGLQGRTTTNHHDKNGNIIRIKRNDGSFESAEYNGPFHKISQHTNAIGKITHYDYDSKGNLIRMIEAVGTDLSRQVDLTYDNYGQRTQITYAQDASTSAATYRIEFDNYGRKTKLTNALGHIQNYQYNALGRMTQLTDALQNTWKRSYDAAGSLLCITDPLNNSYMARYNAAGERIDIVSPNSRITQLSYDKAGRNIGIKIMSADNQLLTQQSYQYQDAQRQLKTIDALGHTELKTFNVLGQVEQVTNRADEITNYSYQQGILQSIQLPSFKQSFSYDLAGNMKSQAVTWKNTPTSDTNSINNQQVFNANHQPVEGTDGNGNRKLQTYDLLGRASRITDALGGITTLSYDSRNNVLTLTDAEQRLTRFSYDAQNQKIAEYRYPMEGVTNSRYYRYDANGKLVQEITPNGDVKSHHYDVAGQRIQSAYYSATNVQGLTSTADNSYAESDLTNVTAEHTVTYQYNKLGLLTKLSEPDFDQTHEYTALGQVAKTTTLFFNGSDNAITKVQSYQYDSRGQKIAYTNPEGITYQYSYTANGEIQKVTIPGQGNITYSGYQMGKAANILFPGGMQQKLNYDGLKRLTSKQLIDPADDNQAQAIYNYDKAHNILSIKREFGDIQYGYDASYRLTTAQHPILDNEQYQYDLVHNRTQRTLTTGDSSQKIDDWNYNNDNQLTGYGINEQADTNVDSISFVYDANGQTVRKSSCRNISADTSAIEKDCEHTLYYYDARERLIKIQKQHNDETKQLIANYGYNQLGQRIWKQVGSDTADKVFFLFDQTGLVAEYSLNQSGDAEGLIKEYHYTPNANFMSNPLFQRSASNVSYYFNDHLGTPQKLFNRTGRIQWQMNYSAFGLASTVSGKINEVENALRFPGQYFDEETSTHYNYYRNYDAELGRYLQSDPIGLGGGVNRFVYVKSNAIKYMDFFGLDAIDVWYMGYPINTGEVNPLTGEDIIVNAVHAGVVSIDPATGGTRYYEYGRYDAANYGVVLRRSIPNLVMVNGEATEDSLLELEQYLSKNFGHNTALFSTYSSDANHLLVNEYAEDFKNNPDREIYDLFSNNCITFAANSVSAGEK